jgi:predicted N-acyltransferase
VTARLRSDGSLAAFGEAGWPPDDAESDFHLSYRWLRSTEGMLASEHAYLRLVDDDGACLAGTPCFVVEGRVYRPYDVVQLLFEEPSAPAAALRRRLPAKPRILICASPYGHCSGIRYAPGVDRAAAAASLARAVGELANDVGADVCAFLYVRPGHDSALEHALAADGYAAVTLNSSAELRLEWDDFDGYVRSLGRGARNVHRETARFAAEGGSVERAGAGAIDERLVPFLVRTQRRYGHRARAERFVAGLARIREHLGDEARLFLVRGRDGRLNGITLFYAAGRRLYGGLAGFLPTAPRFAYFNAAFYEPIRAALESACSEIEYGCGSHKAKQRRGCELKPLVGWIRIPCAGDALATHLGRLDRVNRARYGLASAAQQVLNPTGHDRMSSSPSST